MKSVHPFPISEPAPRALVRLFRSGQLTGERAARAMRVHGEVLEALRISEPPPPPAATSRVES